MKEIIYIFIGGGMGSVTRYLARWKYHIYGSFNYEYLFDAQGQLVKMKPVL